MWPTKMVEVVVGSHELMSPVVAVVSVPPDIGVAAWPVVVPSPAVVVPVAGLLVVADVLVVPPHDASKRAATMTIPVAIKDMDFILIVGSYLLPKWAFIVRRLTT